MLCHSERMTARYLMVAVSQVRHTKEASVPGLSDDMYATDVEKQTPPGSASSTYSHKQISSS